MNLHVRRVGSFAELGELSESWNAVAARTPFSTWQWLRTWAEHYLREEDLYTLVAETNSRQLIGVLPLCRDHSLTEGRVLRWMGSGTARTDFLTLFAPPDLHSFVSQEMARWLVATAHDRALGWDSLLLESVTNQDAGVGSLTEALQSHGSELLRSPATSRWQIDLPPTWDEYLANLSQPHRQQLLHIEREFLDSGRTKLHTVESEAQFGPAFDHLIALHQNQLNRQAELGMFASDRFMSFLSAASERLLEGGMLRLHWMELAGIAIAAEWNLSDGSTTYSYLAGKNPDVTEIEPGRLITIAALRRAIVSGHQAYAFLRGGESYKAELLAKPQPTTTWRCISPSRRNRNSERIHRIISPLDAAPETDGNARGRVTAEKITVEKITEFEYLSAYRATWNELAAKTSQAQFFQTYDWFATYWKNYGDSQRLQVLIVRAADRVIGIVPLVVRVEQRKLGRLRVLTFPLDDWGSFYGPITTDPLATAGAAVDYIAAQPKSWDILSWRWLAPDGVACNALSQAMGRAKLKTLAAVRETAGLIDLPDNWNAYLASRTSKFRNNVRRWERRVQEQGTLRFQKYRPSIDAHSKGDPRWDLYDTCVHLASKSWQGSSTNGTTLSHEKIRAFLREMHATAVALGAADLNLMYLDEKPVAFEYGYWWHGYKYSLRFGYDAEICQSGLGNLMWLQTIKASVEAGDHTFDMGPGSLEYKRFFANRICECRTLDHFRRFAPRAQAIAWKQAFDQWFSPRPSTT